MQATPQLLYYFKVLQSDESARDSLIHREEQMGQV